MTQIIKHVRAHSVSRLSQPGQGRSDQSTPRLTPPSTLHLHHQQIIKPGRQRSVLLIDPLVLCGHEFSGLITDTVWVVTFHYLNQKINCCNELMKLIQPFQSQDDKSEEGTMNPLIGAFISPLSLFFTEIELRRREISPE